MSKKILIAEDNADIRTALEQLIKMRGFEVVGASGGFEAVELTLKENPDLILMDLAMPDLNGIDAAKEIRTDPAFAQVPMLCVSSYSAGHEDEIKAAGYSEVFSKTTFIASIDEILNKYLSQ